MDSTREWRKLDPSNIIESVYDGIFITDGKGVVQLINKGYERISGLKREDLIGDTMSNLEAKGVISQSVSLLVIKEKRPLTIEQRFIATDKIVLVSGNPIFDEKGEIQFVVTSVRDVTEIIQLKDELEETQAQRVLAEHELELIRSYLEEKIQLIAMDKNMVKVIELAKQVAGMDTTVLITGETGVGKNELAQFIHEHSPRADKKFVTVNCAVLPESLVESILFGYEEGSFTGASREGKPGLFEIGDQGTIFIDEIGELSPGLQIKLLRVLEERTFERIGSTKSIEVNIRIVIATNRNLQELVEKKKFREDLFYRINTYPIHIPPLRERPDDILPLARVFLAALNHRYSHDTRISRASEQILKGYSWPGNVRELKNAIERAYILSEKIFISARDLAFLNPTLSVAEITLNKPFSLKEHLLQEEYVIMMRYARELGSFRKAAQALEMEPSTFIRKKQRFEQYFKDR
jgi:PAS domain S-box-containing protein